MWLTVAWLWQTEGPLAVALGFVSAACTGFLGSYSLWIYTLLSLDVVGRTLDLPQGKVPCLQLGLKVDGVAEYVEGMEGREEVGIWTGIVFLKKSNKKIGKKMLVHELENSCLL